MKCFLLAAALLITAPVHAQSYLRSQTLKTLVTFSSFSGSSTGKLAESPDGSFYGVTGSGGTYGQGTVYKFNAMGVLTTLYNFCAQSGCPDGALPIGALTRAMDGNFYGTTHTGGAYGQGTVYRITPAGVETTLYSFCSQPKCPDGANPAAGLVEASDGNLYGTTEFGGVEPPAGLKYSGGCGTVYKITVTGNLTTLYRFCAADAVIDSDGRNPNAELMQAADGALYGTTEYGGGTNTFGTAFKISTAGAFQSLHSFCAQSGCPDGAEPRSVLVQATDGNLYGTTFGTTEDGGDAWGTVFRLSPSGAVTTVYTFCALAGCVDGATPVAGLFQASDGNFYGTAAGGGYGGAGTIFRLTPTGTLTTLYNFCSVVNSADECVDGNGPLSTLVLSKNGNFYGTTTAQSSSQGPFYSNGTIFSFSVFPARTALTLATDYMGDGRSEFTVWRPSIGYFYSNDGNGKTIARQWGLSTDVPVTGDFDGDGKSDIAVWRPSTGYWYITQSSDGEVVTKQWGAPTDVPVVGDFDGDGKTDIAVWRPSTGNWYINQSGDGEVVIQQWGELGDVPVPGYYDGEGVTELAVWRPTTGNWYVLQTATGNGTYTQWGQAGDVPVAKDFDGDGKTDFAVWRASNGTWYVIDRSTNESVSYQWGTIGDVPLGGTAAK